MPANDILCKYDPDHGIFRTPVKLSQHYAAVHADVWTPKPKNERRYRCSICGGVFRNPSSHVQQRHPAEPRPYVGRVMLRVDDGSDGIGGAGRPKNGVDVIEQLHAIESQGRVVHHGPWHVDDIVLPVVEQLALPKGLVPVDHLGAIFAWRDATAIMLSAVTGPRGR